MEGVIGYVTMFAGTFAPKSWAFCNGQTINIASNTALFSILGTTYGGNGTTTFQLPNTKGRTVVGSGQGPGLSMYNLGQTAGTYSQTISSTQMPAHVHPVSISAHNPSTDDDATVSTPAGSVYARDTNISPYDSNQSANGGTFPAQLNMTNMGNNAPVATMRPMLGMNYIICQYGVFPARN